MSSISSSSSATSGTLGNAPPVSFPGVSSGIDYNAIIEKYTADTLLQERPAQAQITNLNAQTTAILKLSSLAGAVQDALTQLSDPSLMNAFSAKTGNTASGYPAATASPISGETPVPGTYIINAQTAATASTIINNPLANGALDATVPLDRAGTAISISNGSAANGKVTVNGVLLNFDASTQTIGDVVSELDTALASSNGGSAVLNADGTVTLTGVLSLGSGADSGNLLHVLKLDTGQLVGGVVTSSSPIAGINENSVLDQNNGAGFANAVTSGSFTINGVPFTVNPAIDTLAGVIRAINASAAGVVATYNAQTSSLTLTSKTAGPQSILLGASADSSNFLSAAGLTSGTVRSGTQASLTYTNAQGTHTVYSATNDFTNVIPGIDLSIESSSPASLPAGSTFYTVTVAADPLAAEKVINGFITAYNTLIKTLNADTAVPSVSTSHAGATGIASSTQTKAGGVLYGNFGISRFRDSMVEMVSGFIHTGSDAYNSLASVGIVLDTNSEDVGASDSADDTITVNATSGALAPLDTARFEAAYAANTAAVSALFTLAPKSSSALSGFAYQFGSLLANTDGTATFLKHGLATPSSLANVLFTSLTDGNTRQITSLQQRIDLIEREATQQADSLRAQFSASESYIAKMQALQTQIAAIGH